MSDYIIAVLSDLRITEILKNFVIFPKKYGFLTNLQIYRFTAKKSATFHICFQKQLYDLQFFLGGEGGGGGETQVVSVSTPNRKALD